MWKAEPTGREAELVNGESEFQGSEAKPVLQRGGVSVMGAETKSKRQGLFREAEPMLQGGGASDGEAEAEAVPGRAAQASLAPC